MTRQNSRLPNVWYEIKSKCKFIHEMLSSLYAQEFISLLSSMHRRLYADPDISSSSFGDFFQEFTFLVQIKWAFLLLGGPTNAFSIIFYGNSINLVRQRRDPFIKPHSSNCILIWIVYAGLYLIPIIIRSDHPIIHSMFAWCFLLLGEFTIRCYAPDTTRCAQRFAKEETQQQLPL